MNRGADGDHFVRVHALVRLPVEQVTHNLLHPGNAGGAAHQHHLVDLRRIQAGVGKSLLAGARAAHQKVLDHLLEARPRELHHQVLRAAGVGGDEGQVDLGLEQRGQLDLGLLGGFLQPLQRHLVLGKIDAVLVLEFADNPVDDALIDVVAAQMRVAVGRLDLDHALADLQNGNVEGSAAKVIDRNGLVLLLVQPVGQRRGGRLVDDAHHLQAGDLARVLGGLALGVVEVGGHGDDRLGHLLPQVGFGGFLQLGQNHRRDFGRRILLSGDVNADVVSRSLHHPVRDHLHLFVDFVDPAAHEALDGVDRVLRIGDRLPLGNLADQPLAAAGEAYHRGRRAGALLVGDHYRLAAFHDGHNRVGRSQVDPDDLTHDLDILLNKKCGCCHEHNSIIKL